MEIEAVGGYEGVGRNMTLVRVDGAQLALDCGIKLDSYLLYYGKNDKNLEDISQEDLLKIGAIPELKTDKPIDAFLVSHGHLDHIGAIQRYIGKHPGQVFSTEYAAGLMRNRLEKTQLGKLSKVNYGQNIQITPKLSAELIQVTHSIPQASMVNIHSSEGDIVYACDYKFDDHSKIAKTNYKKLKSIGNQGVKTLIVEALDVNREGKCPSEKVARAKIRDTMAFAHENGGLIVATTFSTHLERLQTLVTEADKLGRKIIIVGNSFLNNCKLGQDMKLLKLPEGTQIVARKLDNVLSKIKNNNRDKYMVLATGHQGEPKAVLSRMVDNQLKFRLHKDDSVIFSSSTIPSDVNIANKGQLVDKLMRLGVRVYDDVHVSGHANKEEHRKLIRMLNPENIIPAHGNIGMIANYFDFAESEGYKSNTDVHLMRNGDSITL
jgi:ribonuclease J